MFQGTTFASESVHPDRSLHPLRIVKLPRNIVSTVNGLYDPPTCRAGRLKSPSPPSRISKSWGRLLIPNHLPARTREHRKLYQVLRMAQRIDFSVIACLMV